jgi:DNA primase
VIMAHQHGITNAVAVLGTALGERHVPLVRRFTDSVTLVLDGDEAGQNRTIQILDELLALFVAQEIDLQILTLPEGADPCDVIASQGSDAFRHLLSTSVDALDHKINAVTNGLASAPGTHRSAQAVEEILSSLARALPQQMGATSAAFVREQQVISRIGREFGLTEEALHTRLSARRREIASRSRFQSAAKPASETPRSAPRLTLLPWVRVLLELLLHQPECLPRVAEVLTPEEIPSDVCRGFYTHALAAMHAGQIPSFDQLMLSTDDPDAKNLLVDCDEHGRDKLTSDTDQRVRDLLARIAEEKETAYHQTQLAELKQNRLDPEHEQEVLSELFNDFRRRQTGSSPTDG